MIECAKHGRPKASGQGPVRRILPLITVNEGRSQGYLSLFCFSSGLIMSRLSFIDTHAHLDDAAFVEDYLDVLERSCQRGVKRIVLPGVTAQGWERLWQLAEQQKMLYAAPGLHPVYLAQHRPEHLSQLKEFVERQRDHPKLCALGEIGLDYWIPHADRPAQQQLLEAQLKIASEIQLPVLLHVRRAHAPMIATLKRYRLQRGGIVHAFSGSLEEAKEYQKLGFLLGLGGAGTWPQAQRMQRVLKQLPLEALVLETDAPDLAPVSHPNQRNSPEYLPDIAQNLAKQRGISLANLAEAAYQNSCRILGWH